MPSPLVRQQGNLDAVSEEDDEMEQQEEDPDHRDFFDVIDIDWETLVDLLVIRILVVNNLHFFIAIALLEIEVHICVYNLWFNTIETLVTSVAIYRVTTL